MRRSVAKLACQLLLAAGVAALPLSAAQAVDLTFTGSGSSGTDPLGGVWTAGPNFAGFATWIEPLVNNQFPVFNAAGLSNGAGDFATSFTFTYTGAVADPLNTSFDEDLTHVASPEGTVWIPTFLSPTSIEFDAPPGEQLNPGDTFSLYVGFIHPLDLSTFSFSATWGDGAATAAVPEPATWAMMLLGFGAMGLALRLSRRRGRVLLSAAA